MYLIRKVKLSVFLLSCVILMFFIGSVYAQDDDSKREADEYNNVITVGSFPGQSNIEKYGSPTFYLGRNFGIITILGNISYCYYSTYSKNTSKSEGEDKSEIEEVERKVSSLTPSIGIKLRLPRERVIPYIYGEVGKEVVLSSTVKASIGIDWLDEAHEEQILRKQHDEPHFTIGFGLEFPLNKQMSIGGEVGISYLKVEYEYEYEYEISIWRDTKEFHESSHSDLELTSYSKINLNYYF